MQRNEHRRSFGIAPTDLAGGNTNNQNPQPNHTSNTGYSRDREYYYSDGSGVFLVDSTLFKSHAGLIFGPRPVSSSGKTGGASAIYIEDISPRLPSSSDTNPIELPDIPLVQFRNYLLALLGRPYDVEYLKLLTSYYDCTKHSRDLCVRYLDIATLARRFGMIKVEEWALNALHTIFAGPAESLTRVASEPWNSETLLRLITFTRDTKLATHLSTFIQYFISVNTKETTGDDTTAARTGAIACVGIYNGLKESNDDLALLGCAFLNILSLGHRSSIRGSGLTRHDRAVLYAAQVELIDVSTEFRFLQWLQSPGPILQHHLCGTCYTMLTNLWTTAFYNCKKDLGSGVPLKDM
ncbi:hypothetical protein RSAG8_06832, partial [Rhizoctonia solani AG-8 WAC10335]